MAGSRQSAVLDLISQGEYSYASNHTTALARTLDTLATLDIHDNSAGTTDLVVSWARVKFYTQSLATSTMVSVCAYKLNPSEATPTWNSETIQKLRDQGRLFFLKTVYQERNSTGGCREFNMEFFNVKLRVGEKLQIGVIYKTTVADAVQGYVLEKRVLTVGVA